MSTYIFSKTFILFLGNHRLKNIRILYRLGTHDAITALHQASQTVQDPYTRYSKLCVEKMVGSM